MLNEIIKDFECGKKVGSRPQENLDQEQVEWMIATIQQLSVEKQDLTVAVRGLKRENEQLKEDSKRIYEAYRELESDIEFYWGRFHLIDMKRLNPDTSDEEKWEEIGEIISSTLKPNAI